MRKVLTFLFAMICFTSHGNHIVGGEIEFIYLADGLYRIRVIQYFDDANEINPGPEPTVVVSIFSNRDNQIVSNHELTLLGRETIPYTNEECFIDELQTSRVVWTADVELDPQAYADTEGYYIVWERCCRNENVVNIINPLGTGMKYVLEIPPLWVDGRAFVNSSPILFQPLSDYACVNQLYYIEFTGTDPDGDSLAYTLTTPLNSSAAVAVPIPQPKPHPLVQFSPPFSVDNTIPGIIPLGISSRGLLTVTPSTEGLYVFSVLVEEFRSGVKIGEVQRDFQMLVINEGCAPPDPPIVGASVPGNASFQTSIDTLSYAVGDEEKCFDFFVTNITPGETISLRAEGVNFEGDLENVFSVNNQLIGENQDTLKLEVCVSDCPPIRDGPFVVDFIAGDDACPLPQLDTLRMIIEVEPPPNNFPVISPSDRSINLGEDDFFSLDIQGTDADGENMTMALYVPGVFDPAESGFGLEVVSSSPGSISGVFSWDTDCEQFDFSLNQQFEVAILIEDLDTCNAPNPDTLWINSNVLLPANTIPQVALGDGFDGQSVITVRPEGNLDFDVTATDLDGDTVNLMLIPLDFDPDAFGLSFTDRQGVGEVASRFSWGLDCPFENDLTTQFNMVFVAEDVDKCQTVNADSLFFTVNIDYSNEAPIIDRFSIIDINVNEPFELEISGRDANAQDNLTLDYFDGIRRPDSPSLNFTGANARGTVSSILSWTPECSLLDGDDEGFFDLAFVVFDDACPENTFDSTRVTFRIINPQGAAAFIPPNAFSPNGDGKNDVFRLTGLDLPEANIPPDNCEDAFEYISIRDRSGKAVFESSNREFAWDGQRAEPGIYYYIVQFVNSQYKGFVQLLR